MKLIAALLAPLLLIPPLSHAADRKGNGGNIVLCENSNQAELFDLFEGRILYGLHYNESNRPYKEQARQYILELAQAIFSTPNPDPDIDGGIQKNLEENFINMKVLPEGAALSPIDDNSSPITPRGCKVIQAANFIDSVQNRTEILIDGYAWKLLSETQKAALLVHETIYQYLRHPGPVGKNVEINSVRTRMAVAKLFSGVKPEPIEALIDLKPGSLVLSCSTLKAIDEDRNGSGFYLYTNKANQTIVQFTSIGGRVLLTRTTMNVFVGSSGMISDGGNVNSAFIDNLNAVLHYHLTGSQISITVRDADGYQAEEELECSKAVDGSYTTN